MQDRKSKENVCFVNEFFYVTIITGIQSTKARQIV